MPGSRARQTCRRDGFVGGRPSSDKHNHASGLSGEGAKESAAAVFSGVAAAIASIDLRVTLEDRLFVGFGPEVVGRQTAEEECCCKVVLHVIGLIENLRQSAILREPVQNQPRFVDATDVRYVDPLGIKGAHRIEFLNSLP